MSEVLFLLILCSGGCFGAVCLQKRFEQMLPITCGLCALWVFLFGLVGLLPVGPVLLLPVALAVYGYCAWRLWRSRDFSGLAARLLTPGAVCFLLAYLALLVLNRGMMVTGSDPFGHWGLAVKEMLLLDDFSTSPLSVDKYANYPPIMACFQYILQRFLQLRGQTQMSEWHLFFSYQMFFLAFLLPFMKYADWRRPISALFGFGILCTAPMVVFPWLYNTILIDPFLAIVFPYAMVMVLTEQYTDKCGVLGIGIALSVLMLAKDSGVGFAAIILMSVACMCTVTKQSLAAHWRLLVVLAAFMLVPKILWSAHVAMRGCVVAHASEAGLGDYLRFLTLRDTSGYRYGIVLLFSQLLYRDAYYFELFGLHIPYIYAMMGVLLVSYLLQPSLKKHSILGQRASRLFCPLMNTHMVVYLIGLLYVYLFRMPYHDAVGVSEMDRYINAAICSIWMVQLILLLMLFFQAEGFEKSRLSFLLTCVLLLLIPVSDVIDVASRKNVRTSQEFREPYEAVASAVREVASPQDRIFTVSQPTIGAAQAASDDRIFIYTLRPNYSEAYNLGDSDWAGDYQTNLTCDELVQRLKDGFEFLVLYHLNDYFLEHYADAFVQPEEIYPSSIYRVDPESGLLSLVRRVE